MQRIYPHLPWINALVAGIVYLLTLAPGLVNTDSGELAAVQYTFGVAHPTGYPLFTLLGGIFSHLPLPGSVAWKLNLLACLYVSGGIFLFTRTLQLWLGTFRTQGETAAQTAARNLRAHALICLSAPLMLAFTPTVWATATATEVYSLHFLLLNLLCWLTVRAWLQPVEAVWPWRWAALAAGLGLANHLTLALMIPGLVMLLFMRKGLNRGALLTALSCTLLSAGITLGLYMSLFFIASGQPAFNWGMPNTWENLLYHVQGKQFQNFWEEGAKLMSANLKAFGGRIFREYLGLGLALGAAGLVYLLRIQWKLAAFTVLGFGITALYVSHYAIHDLEPYFLACYLMTAFWLAAGLRWLSLRLVVQGDWKMWLAGAGVVAAGVQLGMFWKKQDRSAEIWYEAYSREMLEALPQRALLISGQWDVLVSQAWYWQAVEGMRPDVDVIDHYMLRDRHWYLPWMAYRQPALYAVLQPHADRFAEELVRFNLQRPFDGALLGREFSEIWSRLMLQCASRPVWVGPEVMFEALEQNQLRFPPQVMVVPDRYVFRVVPVATTDSLPPYAPMQQAVLATHFPEPGNLYADRLHHLWSGLMKSRAQYERTYGNAAAAQTCEDLSRRYAERVAAGAQP